MSDTNIIHEEPPQRGRVRAKWGFTTDLGYLTAPYVLFLHQAELGLSSECLNVLLNFVAHWHAEGRMSYPHTNTIAKRMGTSRRSVQRSLSWLIKNGFMAKAPKLKRNDRQGYDLRPLVEKLKPYAWARIQLLQERRQLDALSDSDIEMLARMRERPTAQQMFGEHLKNVPGYPVEMTLDEMKNRTADEL